MEQPTATAPGLTAPVNPPEGDPLDFMRAGETGLNPVPQGSSNKGDSMKSLMFAPMSKKSFRSLILVISMREGTALYKNEKITKRFLTD